MPYMVCIYDVYTLLSLAASCLTSSRMELKFVWNSDLSQWGLKVAVPSYVWLCRSRARTLLSLKSTYHHGFNQT